MSKKTHKQLGLQIRVVPCWHEDSDLCGQRNGMSNENRGWHVAIVRLCRHNPPIESLFFVIMVAQTVPG